MLKVANLLDRRGGFMTLGRVSRSEERINLELSGHSLHGFVGETRC